MVLPDASASGILGFFGRTGARPQTRPPRLALADSACPVRCEKALAISGIPVEEGRSEHKGESHTALATARGSVPNTQVLGGELPMVRERATILAIDMLRKTLLAES
jgi:hypothetical protein